MGLGSFQLWITNCPAGSVNWTLRSYDQAVGAWREWQLAIPIADNYYVSNIELNSYWCMLRCWNSTGGLIAEYTCGPFNLTNNGAYTINAQTGAMTGGAGAVQAQIQSVNFPSSAAAGSQVQVSVVVKNIGTAEGALEIWGYPGDWASPDPRYVYVPAGGQTTFVCSFTMPSNEVSFNIIAGHWDTGTALWVQDQQQGPFSITVTGVGVPIANITNVSGIPASAVAGTVITATVTMRNAGTATGLFQPWVKESNVGWEGITPSPFWQDVAPGATAVFTMRFTMPSNDATFRLVAAHWNGSIWVEDKALAPTVVTLTGSEALNAIDYGYARCTPTGVGLQLLSIWPHLAAVQGELPGHAYDAANTHKYDPCASSNALTVLVAGLGYWVAVDAACTLTYPNGRSQTLISGWNMIGWLEESCHDDAALAATQLASILSVMDSIWQYSNGTYQSWNPSGGDFTRLTIGLGYLIHTTAAATLTYGGFTYPLVSGWTLIGWRGVKG